jgi:hypothetical protein
MPLTDLCDLRCVYRMSESMTKRVEVSAVASQPDAADLTSVGQPWYSCPAYRTARWLLARCPAACEKLIDVVKAPPPNATTQTIAAIPFSEHWRRFDFVNAMPHG